MVIKPLWWHCHWHNVTDEYDIKPDQYEKMNKYYQAIYLSFEPLEGVSSVDRINVDMR